MRRLHSNDPTTLHETSRIHSSALRRDSCGLESSENVTERGGGIGENYIPSVVAAPRQFGRSPRIEILRASAVSKNSFSLQCAITHHTGRMTLLHT